MGLDKLPGIARNSEVSHALRSWSPSQEAIHLAELSPRPSFLVIYGINPALLLTARYSTPLHTALCRDVGRNAAGSCVPSSAHSQTQKAGLSLLSARSCVQ